MISHPLKSTPIHGGNHCGVIYGYGCKSFQLNRHEWFNRVLFKPISDRYPPLAPRPWTAAYSSAQPHQPTIPIEPAIDPAVSCFELC